MNRIIGEHSPPRLDERAMHLLRHRRNDVHYPPATGLISKEISAAALKSATYGLKLP